MEEPKFSKDGLFDGKWEQFYEDGETKMTFSYDRNNKDQIWMSYFPDNRRQNYTFYNQDTLITNYDFKYYDNIKIVDNPDYYDYEYYMNLQIVEKPRYDNLQIIEEPEFDKNGLYDGKWESFFENGDPWRTFFYEEGLKVKLWSVFFDSTGVRHSETNYENDLRHGQYQEWYENIIVRPKEEGLYKEGVKDLLWSYWNEFQEKRFEEWRDGILYDSFEYEYYPNGQVKEEPSYKDRRKHGDWVRYFPNGDIMGTRTFKVGLKEGLWIEYYKNPPGDRDDIIAWKGKYVTDKKEGKWEWFWLNQEKQRVDNYKKGEMTSEKCFERDGSGQTRDCSEVRYESSR
jgi:antitoxin component YwqK of YwqJK toxin-antitoxin module